MRRREFLKLASAAAASTGVAACISRDRPEAVPGRPPDIVLVFADQLRADVLGVNGVMNIDTPHLDRLADEGIAFDNALSTCPLCAPYRGMLMTGRYPTHSGVVINRVNISPVQNPHCLAGLFAGAGYDTGYLGKWHLSAGIGPVLDRHRGDREAIAEYKARHPDIEFTPPGADRLGFSHWETTTTPISRTTGSTGTSR